MTLAVGMRCKSEVILAADTRLSYGPGRPVSEGQKMTNWQCGSCNVVIAQSADDVYAANSVMADIIAKIKVDCPDSLPQLENAVEQVMLESYAPVHDNRPYIQLLVAACVGEEKALYFCTPPNTMSPIWDDCHAIGEAHPVVNEIGKWFETHKDQTAHERLCQLSYMMYRAKLLYPDSVGGHTDVAVLTDSQNVPLWIERISMDVAESYGIALERHLSQLMSLVMGGSLKGHEDILKAAEGIYSCSMMYAAAEFRCQFPDIVIRRQFYT